MCGIVGIVQSNTKKASRELVEQMTDSLAHRGPDGRGVAEFPGAVLGHRRLSIIDLATGAQPMVSASGRSAITFNGEIYNYVELREELQRRGVTFKTTSDTEVLLELLERDGAGGINKLNGQFAFGFYDTQKQTLMLGRDRLGEKPLYYCHLGGELAFGSEVKALALFLRGRERKLSVSEEGFFNYLSLNYVPFGRTMLEGVYSLPPGTILEFGAGKSRTHSYWIGEPEPDAGDSLAALSRRLTEAAEIRLRSDVPLGLFLSGGIDSAVVAAALRDLGVAPRAFIADIREPGFSEVEDGRRVADALGLDYSVVSVDPEHEDLAALIPKLVLHGDAPLADSSAVPMYLLARETAREVKVVLSGDGGDELFGGYLTYRATRLAQRIPAPLRRILWLLRSAALLAPGGGNKVGLAEKLERFLRSVHLPPGAAHFAWNGMFHQAQKRRLLSPALRERLSAGDTFVRLAENAGLSLAAPDLQSLLRADQGSYLTDDILVKGDRMTMAHGLELRPVFLDHRLVEFARGLPESALIQDGTGKQILRSYLQERDLGFVLEKPKQGFSIPVHRWFRTKLRHFAGDLFHSKVVGESGLYDPQAVKALWRSHLKGRQFGFELWGVMVSLIWYQQVIRGR